MWRPKLNFENTFKKILVLSYLICRLECSRQIFGLSWFQRTGLFGKICCLASSGPELNSQKLQKILYLICKVEKLILIKLLGSAFVYANHEHTLPLSEIHDLALVLVRTKLLFSRKKSFLCERANSYFITNDVEHFKLLLCLSPGPAETGPNRWPAQNFNFEIFDSTLKLERLGSTCHWIWTSK